MFVLTTLSFYSYGFTKNTLKHKVFVKRHIFLVLICSKSDAVHILTFSVKLIFRIGWKVSNTYVFEFLLPHSLRRVLCARYVYYVQACAYYYASTWLHVHRITHKLLASVPKDRYLEQVFLLFFFDGSKMIFWAKKYHV